MIRKHWISFVLVFFLSLIALTNVRGKNRKRKTIPPPQIGEISEVEGVRLPLYDRLHCHVFIKSGPCRDYKIKMVKRTYVFNETTDRFESDGEYVLGDQTWSGRPPWKIEVMGKGKGLFRELFGGNANSGQYSQLEIKVECDWWASDQFVQWNGYSEPFDVVISKPGYERNETPFTPISRTCRNGENAIVGPH